MTSRYAIKQNVIMIKLHTIAGSWQTTRNMCIYRYFLYLYSLTVMVFKEQKTSHTHKGIVEIQNNKRKLNFSHNFFILNNLKTPLRRYACFSLAMVYAHTMLVLHWSRLTHICCLLSIGYGLHPRIFTPRLSRHLLFVFHWSRLTPTQFSMHRVSRPRISVFAVVILLILSMIGYIGQLHLPGSLPVKAS